MHYTYTLYTCRQIMHYTYTLYTCRQMFGCECSFTFSQSIYQRTGCMNVRVDVCVRACIDSVRAVNLPAAYTQ